MPTKRPALPNVHAVVLHASRCGNNCVFCGTKEFGKIEENVAAALRTLRAAIDRGESIDEVEISGNDPGEYPSLPHVVSTIREWLPGSEIKLATHGKTLSNLPFLGDLRRSGVTQFIIPVYGHTSVVHDAVTRTRGSFVHTIKGLTNLVRTGARFSVTSLITRENQPFLYELLRFVAEIAPYISLGIPYLALPTSLDSVPDLSVLSHQLSAAIRRIESECRLVVQVRNIPRCFVEFEHQHFEDSYEPPVGAYEHWRKPDMIRTGFVEIVNDQILPRYRQFSKVPECSSCRYEKCCPGFLTTYIDHHLFEARPVP